MGINLDLRHLRVIVAVADTGGFGAAAHRLRVAQSAVSRTVQEAERRTGVAVFDRTTRRVMPTADGAQLIATARKVLAEVETGMTHIEGYLDGTRGSVSVAALPSLAAALLPTVLSHYRREHPGIAITVRDGLSAEVLEMVSSGAVDLALTVAPIVHPPLRATRLVTDRFCCVLPKGDPLAKQEEIDWRDLQERPFVHFDTASSIRGYTDLMLQEHHVLIGPVTEARNIGAVAGLVGAGLGVSLVPGLVLPLMRFAGVLHRPLVDPGLERIVCLVEDPRRPLALPARALRSLLLDAGQRGVVLAEGAQWATPTD